MPTRTLLLVCLLAATLLATAVSMFIAPKAFPPRYRWRHIDAAQPHESQPMPSGHLDRG